MSSGIKWPRNVLELASEVRCQRRNRSPGIGELGQTALRLGHFGVKKINTVFGPICLLVLLLNPRYGL